MKDTKQQLFDLINTLTESQMLFVLTFVTRLLGKG